MKRRAEEHLEKTGKDFTWPRDLFRTAHSCIGG